MRLLDMKTFVILSRNRHFGRTAEEMNTTQPAISSRLAQIEVEFGRRLVNRGVGRFSLTAEGERVLKAFETTLEQMDALHATISKGGDGRLEPLRVGAIDSVASTWMPQFVDDLHQRFTDLKIELTVDGTKPLVAGMKRGEFDMIFCLHPVLEEGFRSYTACVWQMMWGGSPKLIDADKIYDVAALGKMPIISFPKNSPPYQMVAPYFHDEQVLASKLTSCNSLFAIINLMINGFGVGAIPTVTIERELKAGLLRPLRVAKSFPPLPIVASYQTTTHIDLTRAVVHHAKRAASAYCTNADPDTAWIS